MALKLKNLLPGLFSQTIDLGGGVTADNSGNVTVPGNLTVSGTTFTDNEATSITSASANALVVGANGATNPALNVDASAATAATGVNIKAAAAAGGVTIQALSSGTNENLFLKSKGQGSILIQPGVDSTISLLVANAAQSVYALCVDTSSSRVGINKTTPNTTLDVAGVITASSATATPAGGSSAAVLLLGTTAAFGIYYGSGAPTVSAAQGSLYIRSDGSSTSTRLYVNTNGTTGWTNLTSAT